MPVSTTTFRDMRKLNVLFAISAVALLGATLWLVLADHHKEWRLYQRDAVVWEVAMKQDAQRNAATAEYQAEVVALTRAIRELETAIRSNETINRLNRELAELRDEESKLKLPVNIAKGEIVPAEQALEHVLLAHGADSTEAKQARAKVVAVTEAFNQKNAQMAAVVASIERKMTELEEAEAWLNDLRSELTRKQLQVNAIQEQLAALQPHPITKFRDAPLLNWFNPSEKPRQVVAPAVLQDLHFKKVESIDRCMSCHVNIDKPDYEPRTLLAFVERQIAVSEGQDVSRLEVEPVVMLEFWSNTGVAAGLGEEVRAIEEAARGALNQLYREIESQRTGSADESKEAVPADKLYETIEKLVRTRAGQSGDLPLDRLYAPVARMRDELRRLVQSSLDEQELKLLESTYREAAITQLNAYRKKDGLAALSASPVLLGHPKLDMYVGANSAHPMDTPGDPVRTFGCTVCHEGAGHETQFEYTAHTPRNIWVDAATGTPIPEFLLDAHEKAAPQRQLAASNEVEMVLTAAASGDQAAGTVAARFSHDDLYLPDADDHAHPFAPKHDHGHEAAYLHPVSGQTRRAVKQEAYWSRAYNWEHVHFMHWERPMHQLDYVESSCTKCHTDVYDIADAAPRLFEGRKLFAQIGCANCHAVGTVQAALDVKKVGPSLVHVKEKLSTDMMGSWIWSPRSFRPTARMPHYFMLENNSSPLDIRRTRTEVAAITYYLQNAEPSAGYYAQQDKPVPQYTPIPLSDSMLEGSEESIARGREVFNTVGCLACHSNLEDQTRPWLVEDVAKRQRVSQTEAETIVGQMTYNERHWYAQRYISDRITLVGPELSGVGTKLMAGWPEDEARGRAKRWLYDWLRNPQHYSDYTIMPALRLDEQQAGDLADYLLSLERPGVQRTEDGRLVERDAEGNVVDYEPGAFNANAVDTQMLEELVVSLQAVQSTPAMVREQMRQNPDDWTTEKQLEWLGQRMITHYGCVGCHTINGLEDAASACAELNDWGTKDPHKLDFGYFDHAYDKQRAQPFPGWKVAHEGLQADAPHVTADNVDAWRIQWEEMHELERRPWLYHKLHNPRVYDRGRISLDSKEVNDRIDLGRPYDKLKMPKFFLTDRQVRALTTFVTGVTAPGVTSEFQVAAVGPMKEKISKGRQIATLYNCYGCHNIEGNEPSIQQYYGVFEADGKLNANMINWAPPRLVGQGAKTQPDWLYHFLQNVNGHPNIAPPGEAVEGESKIRPWLKVRMPSFALEPHEAQHLVDYFAAHSRDMADDMAATVTTILDFINEFEGQAARVESEIADLDRRIAAAQAGDHAAQVRQFEAMKQSRTQALQTLREQAVERRANWFDTDNESVRAAMTRLAAWWDALHLGHLMTSAPLDAEDFDTRSRGWNDLLRQVSTLSEAFHTDYPYIQKHMPVLSEDQYIRGEKLFMTMNCSQGDCHRVGDHEVLARAGLLMSELPPVDEGYGDEEGYGYEDEGYGDDEGYGEEEGYGYGEEEGAAPAAGPTIVRIAAKDEQPGGAPNLSLVHKRLQRHWVEQWLRHAEMMQPGTRMQIFWKPDAQQAAALPPGQATEPGSHFRTDIPYPQEQRDHYEALYGPTGAYQRQLMVDFLYSVGAKAITYGMPPDGPRLSGPQPGVELQPLTPEQIARIEAGQSSGPSPTTASTATPAQPRPEPTPQPAPQPEPAAEQPREPEPEVSTIEDFHDEATKAFSGTRVVGQVTFAGNPPRRNPVRMTSDPFCAQAHRGKPVPRSEMVVVNEDKTFRNVVVYVSKGLEGKPKPAKTEPAIIDQVDCLYTPHVLAVMTGQPVEIHNSDNTMHNVNFSGKNPAFNDAMVKGVVLKKVFNTPELGGGFKCNVHPWMGARLAVFDHPYFFVTDVQGRFEIRDLPPGTYTLSTWHEDPRLATVEFEVTVEADTSTRADVEIAPR